VKEKRFYQRYTIIDKEDETLKVKIKIDGIVVNLVDFSLGGLCFLSEKIYSVGDIVTILVYLEDRGQIDLTGKVVRVTQVAKFWSIAVDLSNIYKLNSLRKL